MTSVNNAFADCSPPTKRSNDSTFSEDVLSSFLDSTVLSSLSYSTMICVVEVIKPSWSGGGKLGSAFVSGMPSIKKRSLINPRIVIYLMKA